MSFIDQKEIFEKTNGGRDVIETWYPASTPCFENPQKKFKARESEKTASCAVKQLPDGVWVVTDFGNDQKAKNCIAVVQLEENCDFKTAIQIIATRFNILPEDKKSEIFKPEIRQRDAMPDEVDGDWIFETKDFTKAELQNILAPKVWEYLLKQAPKGDKKPEELVMDEVVRIFKLYHFHSLKGYKVIKNRKVTEIDSTEHYPIFMFDEGLWKKIYQPRNMDPGRRFTHNGTRPSDFIFGYAQATKGHSDLLAVNLDDEEESIDAEPEKKDDKKKKKPKKLERVIITAGGSDGLNIACIGQCFKTGKEADQLAAKWYPVWMNSETAKLSAGHFRSLQSIADKVYNLPDIDATGIREAHALALDYLELHTIFLPEELREKRDAFRNKACKDLRDYFRFWTPWDFEKLFKTAYPYRFWDVQPRYNKQGEFQGMGYVVNNKYMLNFLHRNGFYRYPVDMEDDTYFYIQIEHNVVTKVGPKKIRDYVNSFIERRFPEVELMNTFLRTTQMNETSLSSLPYAKIDFNDFDRESQWFFFNNKTVRVAAQGVEDFRPSDVSKYVWREEVLQHRFTRLDDFFTISPITMSDGQGGEINSYDITIHNQDCMVLRYLINISRMFWREELEERLDGIPDDKRQEYATHHSLTEAELKLMDGLHRDDKAAYLEAHRWDIAGPLLTAAEQHEQKLHLINKLFQIGYQFHRYKSPSRAWATWTMDAKLSDGNESHGGSGKSLLPKIIFEQKLMQTEYIGASDPKVLDNKHVKENITEHTDLIFVDDCSRYFNFRFFFADITTATTVNPKNTKSRTIAFEDSAKLWFTSNFPPNALDASTSRRILYTLNSDYYHNNDSNEYRESRSPYDEFGKNLGRDFDEHEWNLMLNLIVQCVKFYLNTEEKINPPMDNINKRNLKALMGDAFQGWADVYFSDPERVNVAPDTDHFVLRDEAFEDFRKSNNQSGWTPNKLVPALKAWCKYMGYELNPSDVAGWTAYESGRGGRIVRKVKIQDKTGSEKSTTKEVIWIRVPKKEVEEEKLPF